MYVAFFNLQIDMLCSIVKSDNNSRILAGSWVSRKTIPLTSLRCGPRKDCKETVEINVVTDLFAQISSLVGKQLGRVEDNLPGTILNSFPTVCSDFDEVGVKN